MKKASLLILGGLLSISSIMVGQNIPNHNFEDWTDFGTYQDPDLWATLNLLSASPLNNPISVTPTTGADVYSGTYGIKVRTIQLTTNPFPTILPNVIGVAFTGAILGGTTVVPGYFYAGRPDTLYYHFKYFPQVGDTGGVFVNFTRFDPLLDSTIALGGGQMRVDTTTNNFEFGKTTINWTSSGIPDTAFITISPSAGGSPIPDSYIIVDSLYYSDAQPTVSQIEGDTLLYDLNFVIPPITISETVVAWNDSTMISGAMVRITSGFVPGEDSLFFTPVSGITGSYSASTGTILFNGTATFDTYTTVLRSVKYKNYDVTPTFSTRKTEYTITDGQFTSNIGVRYVGVFNSTGITKPSVNANFKAYPVPAREQLILSGLSDGQNTIRITDLLGNVMLNTTVSGGQNINLNLSQMTTGLYVLEVLHQNESSSIRRKISINK